MGTRGIWGFVKNEKKKVTYNHFDSYPSVLGEGIVKFLDETTNSQLENIFDKIILVNETEEVDEETLSKFSYLRNKGVSSGDDWYSYLRESQGKPEIYRDTDLLYMIDSEDFLEDAIFCEWAYIYNLDTKTLNVYKSEKNSNENFELVLVAEISKDELKDFDITDLDE